MAALVAPPKSCEGLACSQCAAIPSLVGDNLPVDAPFHGGEISVQDRVGQRVAHAPIRAALPPQHMAFYPLLEILYVGSVDASGQPWASAVTGRGGARGFATCPNNRTLRVEAAMHGDPLADNVTLGAPLGVLGLQHHTRRRNRANGRVASCGGGDGGGAFTLEVSQSFGNCPQYITTRVFQPRATAGDISSTGGAPAAVEVTAGPLSLAAGAIVAAADTFFISSVAPLRPGSDVNDPRTGVDISHRGGKPGFARLTGGGGEIEFPDLVGNFFFNTLGNLQLEPRCGLLFIDWPTGDVLHVAGRASIEWGGRRVAAFAGAQRIVTVAVTAWLLRPGVLGVVQSPAFPIGASPFVAAMADWATADAAAAAATAADEWRPFTIVEVADETIAVRSFTLAPSDGGSVAPHAPGQHLRLKFPGFVGAERSYSLTAPANGRTLRISVRKQGPVSGYLHDACGVGATLLARPPAGVFVLDAASPRPAVFASAGIGVTPLYAMLEGALPNDGGRATPAASRGILWVHVARNGEEHAFRDRVARLCAAAGIPEWIAYTRPRPGADVAGRDFATAGRVSGEDLVTHVGGPAAARAMDWYVCGPLTWWADIKAALREARVPLRQVHWEEFRGGEAAAGVGAEDADPITSAVAEADADAPPPPPPPVEEPYGVRVTFARSGKTLTWRRGQLGSLLDAAEAAGLQLPYSCRLGQCGSCAAPLLRGRACYDLTVKSTPGRHDAADRGDVLLCCAAPVPGERLQQQEREAGRREDHEGAGSGGGGGGASAQVLLMYDGPVFDA